MKKIVTFMVAMLSAVTVFAGTKNDWKGRVVDEKGEPVAYANVAVLSRADSTVVCGVTTEEDGTFNIVTKETDGIMMAAFVNLTPTIGPWTLNCTLGVQPQWLSIDEAAINKTATGKIITFNGHPIWFAQLFNTFTVKGGWQFEVGGQVNSPGYSQNMRLKNVYCDISAAVQKTLLKDGSLVLRLEGSDLAGLAHYDVDSDFGSHVIYQTNMMDTQRIKFSIRYSFNAAQSKYKGTGAGSGSKERL